MGGKAQKEEPIKSSARTAGETEGREDRGSRGETGSPSNKPKKSLGVSFLNKKASKSRKGSKGQPEKKRRSKEKRKKMLRKKKGGDLRVLAMKESEWTGKKVGTRSLPLYEGEKDYGGVERNREFVNPNNLPGQNKRKRLNRITHEKDSKGKSRLKIVRQKSRRPSWTRIQIRKVQTVSAGNWGLHVKNSTSSAEGEGGIGSNTRNRITKRDLLEMIRMNNKRNKSRTCDIQKSHPKGNTTQPSEKNTKTST